MRWCFFSLLLSLKNKKFHPPIHPFYRRFRVGRFTSSSCVVLEESCSTPPDG